MSKELDYLDDLLENKPLTLIGRTIIECIKEKIQRLEEIDNSNPSEALECLEWIIKNYIGNDYYVYEEELITIKQALLKAQEPKQYLKWEDLAFKEEEQTMKILLNGSCYLLNYYTRSEEEFVFIKSTGTTIFNLLGECSDDKQFFNDLRLERVEE